MSKRQRKQKASDLLLLPIKEDFPRANPYAQDHSLVSTDNVAKSITSTTPQNEEMIAPPKAPKRGRTLSIAQNSNTNSEPSKRIWSESREVAPYHPMTTRQRGQRKKEDKIKQM